MPGAVGRTTAKNRLIREGVWKAAYAFFIRKTDEIQRAKGLHKLAAAREAWTEMLGQYPPLTKKELAERQAEMAANAAAQPDGPAESSAAPVEADDEPADPDAFVVEGLPPGTGDVKADLLWAWQNIHNRCVATDAPSGSAWYLLQWGRSEKTRDKFVALAMKTFNQTAEGHDRLRDDRARQFELLKNLRIEFGDI